MLSPQIIRPHSSVNSTGELMLATCSFWMANLCLVRFRPCRIVPSREEWGNAAVFPRSVPLLLEFVMREARHPLSRSARIDSEVLILGVYGSQSNPINSKWITKQPGSFFPMPFHLFNLLGLCFSIIIISKSDPHWFPGGLVYLRLTWGTTEPG